MPKKDINRDDLLVAKSYIFAATHQSGRLLVCCVTTQVVIPRGTLSNTCLQKPLVRARRACPREFHFDLDS